MFQEPGTNYIIHEEPGINYIIHEEPGTNYIIQGDNIVFSQETLRWTF